MIGHGVNDDELAERMCQKLGYQPFPIAKVESEPPMYALPSSETIR